MMSLKFHILLALFGCPLAFFFAACESGSPEEPLTKKETKKVSHPWDWEPEDQELMTGKKIYSSECSLCHNEGEEGAPALTNTAEWALRESKGIDTLIDHAINGFIGDDGKMPARGGTDTLTDEEVTAAVKFMINSPK